MSRFSLPRSSIGPFSSLALFLLLAICGASAVLAEAPVMAAPKSAEVPPTQSPLHVDRLEARWSQIKAREVDSADLGVFRRHMLLAESLYGEQQNAEDTLRRLQELRREVQSALRRALAPAISGKSDGPSIESGLTPAAKADPVPLQGSDRCEEAPLVEFGSYLGTTSGSSRDGVASCAPLGVAGDVWYRVRVQDEESLFVDTAGSSYDTVLSIHESCPVPDQNFEQACDDNSGPGQTSATSYFPSFGGTEVLVRVSGALTDAGDYQLTLTTGGRIFGRVVTESGEPLQGVEVQARSDASSIRYFDLTEADGSFEIVDLPSGTYRAAVPSPGPYSGEVFEDIPCFADGSCPFESGVNIPVELGEAIEIGEFRLALGGTVEGRVRARAGGGIINFALVKLLSVDGFTRRSAFVESDGTYRFTGLPPGSYRAQVETFGEYQDQAWPGVDCPFSCAPQDGALFGVAAGQELSAIDFDLIRLATISGQVRDQSGAALGFQSVRLFDSSGQPLSSSFSDSEGSFSFSGLPAGRYFAVAADEGFSAFVPELYREVDCNFSPSGACDFDLGTAIDVDLETARMDIDFTLSTGGALAGKILDAVDGTPVPEVLVTAIPADGGLPRQTSSGQDGTYLLDGLPGGEYSLLAEPPPFDEYVAVVYPNMPCVGGCPQGGAVSVAFEQLRSDLDFALPRTGAIRGRVTSATGGEPLEGVAVIAGGADFGFTDTAADGSYEITGLDPGEFTLQAFLSGYLLAEQEVQLQVGGSAEDIDFQLMLGGTIEGRVENRLGVGVTATVEVRDQDFRFVTSAFAADGNYQVQGLETGDYYLLSDAVELVPQAWPGVTCVNGIITGCAGIEAVSVSAGQVVTGIDFAHDAFGEIFGSVESAVTGSAVGADLQLVDAAGRLIAAAFTDQDGSYRMTAVAGTYFLVARPFESPLAYMDQVFGGASCFFSTCDAQSGTPVLVDFNTATDASFVLERGGSLSGRVQGVTGQALVDRQFRVELWDEEGGFLRDTPTSDGRWFFGAVPDGRYRLLARDGNGGQFFDLVWPDMSCVDEACSIFSGQTVAVNDGGNVANVDMTVATVEEVGGRALVAGSGLPVAGATVQRWSLTGALLEQTTTGSDGRFSLRFRRDSYLSISSQRWQDTVWPDVPCPEGDCRAVLGQGQVISPRPGQPTQGLDFRLASATECGSATEMCTLDDRFRIQVRWATENAQGEGGAIPLTNESGYFWFFDPANVEVVVKTLDACSGFGHFWVFLAGLTNVDVEVTVLDTFTGATKVYRHEPGDLFAPIFDTSAFATCGAPDPVPRPGSVSAIGTQRSVRLPAPEKVQDAALEQGQAKPGHAPTKSCEASDEIACLTGERFRVEGRFRIPGSESNRAKVVELTSDTAYFWFFGPDNIEVVVKVLDACDGFDRFWVFAAGLTNVEVELTVTDTETGADWTYRNEQGADFEPVADTSTLMCP